MRVGSRTGSPSVGKAPRRRTTPPMSSAGLDMAPPKRGCEDVRCPFHGHLKVRGKMLVGTIVSISTSRLW